MNACSQFFFIWLSDIVATHMSRSLSVRLFLATDTIDRISIPTNFLSAAWSFKLFISAALLDCCSVAVRSISLTEIESLALVTIIKRSHHSSHWMRDKTAVFKTGQNSRFSKRDKTADFQNRTKQPIFETGQNS